MSDVIIVCAREDQGLAERLSHHLALLGLTADVPSGERDQDLDPSSATDMAAKPAYLVVWSRHSISQDGIRALATQALGGEEGRANLETSRYAGLLTGDLMPADLPSPFNDVEVGAPALVTDTLDWDAPPIARLLIQLQTLTGHRRLGALAASLQERELAATRLRAELAARDAALAAAQSAATELRHKIDLQDADLSARASEVSALTVKLSEADRERAELSALASSRDDALRAAQDSATSLRASLEETRSSLRDALDARQISERNLDDARNGLAQTLRQQKQLQSQLDASDLTIQQIMTQREELLSAHEKLDGERAKLAQTLTGSEKRRGDLEQQRDTYVLALVDRKKEIDTLTDQLAASNSELGKLRPEAEKLSLAIKDWRHVPWRSVAAGAAVAGALSAYGLTTLAGAIDSWREPPPAMAAIDPKNTPAAPAGGDPAAPQEDPAPVKSEEKVGPDPLQTVENGAPSAFEVRDPSAPEPETIAIPDDTGVPDSNDQVQFNPDGLPPVDPNSRPPPQDLPPLPQRPKLLLKPPAPPPPGE